MPCPRSALAAMLLLMGLTACLPEIRIGANDGLGQIGGATELPIEVFLCGEPGGLATTRKVEGGCELSLSEDVQVIDEPDYARIANLTAFSGLLEAVELELIEFRLIEATTGVALDLRTTVTSLTLSSQGQWAADQTTLSSLPQTVRLSGEPLQPLKDAIYQRQPASLRLDAVLVVPDDRPLPAGLRFEYRAQPTLVLGGAL